MALQKKNLYIEDNEQNLYLITFLLEKHGYYMLSAQDGQSGIVEAAEKMPDLILFDIQLPSKPGYEVARSFRNNQDLSHVPIVAITSYALIGDSEKALESGCNGYIEKPINADTFVAEIERYLL
jgi:two-component system, cell cycle response regulator DivK